MTLNQFVREQCANFKNGVCLWGACPVLTGERCRVSRDVIDGKPADAPGPDYFGACVAPLAKNFPQYTNAAIEYARICGRGVKAAAAVRVCGCGRPMEPRKRYCADCGKKRRRDSIRENVKRHRAAVIS